MSEPDRRAVVALGGNALVGPGGDGSVAEMLVAAHAIATHIAGLVKRHWSVLVVHGNGPQVGVELLRSEEASTKVPPFGLDLCVASTQGTMGVVLETAIRNALVEEGLGAQEVVSVISLALVDADDPAFDHPTKPIGLFYSRYRARQLLDEIRNKGWDITEDSGRGWRPVVPSPAPQQLLSTGACDHLLRAGFVVIAGGGGGVPVTQTKDGGLVGTEAVIDKDRTATQLATNLKADLLIFLTPVTGVDLNYGTTFARRLVRISSDEAERYLAEGHFAPGSMGPKIEAAAEFAKNGGTALITSAPILESALAGHNGTRITNSTLRTDLASGQRQLDLVLDGTTEADERRFDE